MRFWSCPFHTARIYSYLKGLSLQASEQEKMSDSEIFSSERSAAILQSVKTVGLNIVGLLQKRSLLKSLAFFRDDICSVFIPKIEQMLIIIFILTIFSTFAQTQPSLQLTFSRQNNFTYSTRYGFNDKFQHKKHQFEVLSHHDHLLNSSLENPFVQVFFKNQLNYQYKIHKKWALASVLEADNFVQNQTHRVSVYAGASYQPNEKFVITPLIGYSWDYLSKRLNQGISPALKLRYAYAWKDGLATENQLFIRTKYLQPRHQRNILLKSAWQQSFGKFGNMGFSLVAGSNEMDNFKAKSVEKIQSDTLNPNFMMQYFITPTLSFESENVLNLTRRRFRYVNVDTSNAEFNNLQFSQNEINLRQKVQLKLKKIQAEFQYLYDYSNRRYAVENNKQLIANEYERLQNQEKQKDFLRQGNAFDLKFVYFLKEQNYFTLTGNNRYVMYDTPSNENFDDHDELNYGLSLEWNYRWNQKFITHYQLNGSVRKYAFLYKERSQDNYTQRNLRLAFDYQWAFAPKWLLSGEQFIYVTYNVKDFQDANFTDRSTRNLESRMNLSYLKSEKWQHALSIYRKETHLSYLNWDRFSETALDTTINWVIEQKNTINLLNIKEKGKLAFEFGYKHFQLMRHQNTSMINIRNVLEPINLHIRNFQTGAITGVRWYGKSQNTLNVLIWWQYQYLDNRYRSINAFSGFNNNYQESELQKVGRFFRPFADASMSFWF
ncbi:MAG: hypothetical protein ACKVTZ_10225 [Bacteroidia bacterium]